MKRLTKHQIIDEIAEAYTLNTRSVVGDDPCTGACEYISSDGSGKMCAVGRCLIDPKSIPSSKYIEGFDEELDPLLKPQYRGHTIWFWKSLQSLHDTYDNWNDSGLSNIGKETVKYLKNKWPDD